MAESGSDPGGGWDIHALFCHYNALYFHDSLGACAVSWAHHPLPNCGTSTCHYYPGGGCEILLSKSLLECQNADLKNTLLHEMIHAYMCFNYDSNDHSDHGPSFQNMMNSINSSSVADPQRPFGGYNITFSHEIRKKFHHYKCETCGDLVKTTKSREPSQNDCSGSMAPDGLCENSLCHWHSHKKLCLGTYHKVQETPPGSTELKAPKAEETHVEGKAKELSHGAQQTTHGSNDRGGTNNKHDLKKDAELLQPVGDAAGSSGFNSSSRDDSPKKVKLLKDIESKAQGAATVQETCKRARTLPSKSGHGCSRPKKRKLSKHDNGYTVIIEWLDVFAVEEADENEEPLINKRTERRRKQKMLKITQVKASNNVVNNGTSGDGSADPCCSGPGNDDKPPSHEHAEKHGHGTAVSTDSMSVPGVADGVPATYPLSGHGVAKSQAGGDGVSSPLDSPVRGEIVDISDS